MICKHVLCKSKFLELWLIFQLFLITKTTNDFIGCNWFFTGRFKYGSTYSLGGTNVGCTSMYTWCPGSKPIEFFKWERAANYNPTTHKCVHVKVANNVFMDSLNEVRCDNSSSTSQYICMSKDWSSLAIKIKYIDLNSAAHFKNSYYLPHWTLITNVYLHRLL